jgi:hydroxymethylpyrimidine/phosphomethylpyrimidine kinase
MAVPLSEERNPSALTIAGSDSGAGAGIQADLKTFSACGVYGTSVLTLVTAQNTSTVSAVHLLPPELVNQQLEAVFEDFRLGAVKTGALGSAELIGVVAAALERYQARNLVVDPVMISKHGHWLLADAAVATLRERLIPLAAVVTPNIPEAAVLAGIAEDTSRDWMTTAAGAVLRLGCGAVVLKGGHRATDAADLLLTAAGEHWLEGELLASPRTHGTGCTFSAALTAFLLRGLGLVEACAAAKRYVAGAITRAHDFGRGINPVNHFWQTQRLFGVLSQDG